MSKLTLKNISHENKVGQSGKSFVSCKLVVPNTQTGKDTWISGFGSEITKTWQAGDTVDVDIVQTDKGYWNFSENKNSKPSPDRKLEILNEINAKLDILLATQKTPQIAPNSEPKVGSVSFSPEAKKVALNDPQSPTDADTGVADTGEGSEKIPF